MNSTELEMLKDCGGRPLQNGEESAWDFGWRPSDPETTAAFTVPITDDPILETGEKVFLWEYPRIANGGKLPPFNWQVTGSCVNGGAQNAGITRAAVEVVTLGQPEVFKIPCTLPAYGYSRSLFGWNTEGEGSFGDAMAKALAEVGVTTIDNPDMPQPTLYTHALVYTKAQEFRYSAWKNTPQSVREAAKPHPFQYGKVTNLNEAEAELRRRRPLTWAGNWGGRMSCSYRGEGANRVLWNGGRADTWNHQQSCQGVWRHPQLGRIWCILNQWWFLQNGEAKSVHGEPGTADQLPGAYWISDADMEYQCRTGEVRSLKDFSGFTKGLLQFGNI